MSYNYQKYKNNTFVFYFFFFLFAFFFALFAFFFVFLLFSFKERLGTREKRKEDGENKRYIWEFDHQTEVIFQNNGVQQTLKGLQNLVLIHTSTRCD
jgi:hypothetical protein